ncbi:group I intron-associated PD-(D/E)XK endonuclease [Halorubrum sp. DTA98]|uniref:group I intron-associated PD-(D/E)XK endonuclease n=1 Tax=Halorubrum sp. DTA98 TaxID=3402163 RepID=UPI003AAFA59A
MDSHRRGDLTEQIVITELKRCGVAVSTPIGDNERYDVVIEQPSGNLLRAQIKTGRLRDGVVRFKGVSQHTNASGHVYEQYGDDIDCFLVYCYNTEEIYLIKASEVGSSMHLRVDEPSQETSQVNWAGEYRFDAQWPLEKNEETSTPESHIVKRLERTESKVFVDPDGDRSMLAVSHDPDSEMRRVQIETGWVVDGRIRFSASEPADYHLIHCSELEELFAVHADEFDDSISLRIEGNERKSARTNSAAEYVLENNWPPVIDPGSVNPVARVITRLEDEGYDPHKSSDEHGDRTVVVSHSGRESHIHCESSWINDGCLRFNVSREQVDYHATPHPETGELYLVPTGSFGGSVSLRIEPPGKDDPRINYADEFRFSQVWPP